ncbi:MAG: tetratricopeptide repeat protein [Verrucomicrobia bacterium]|nr:tetratricopeptide repeat protein [Verrucomicrobiota bacterium]
MRSLGAKVVLAAAIAVVVVAVPLTVILSADDAPKTTLERAEEEFGKHNYKRALELYGIVLAGDQPIEHRPRLELKVIICHQKLNEADPAERKARAFVEKYPGTIWEARGCHFLGNLLRVLPHWGYLVDDVVVRGQVVEGAPYVPLHEGDNKEAIELLEKAKALYYEVEAKGDLAAEDKTSLPGEVVGLNFDLADTLAGPGRHYYPVIQQRLEVVEEDVGPAEGAGSETEKAPTYDTWDTYRADGELVDKILFLYEEIARYDTSEDKHPSALALYREGLFLVQISGLTSERGRPAEQQQQAGGRFQIVHEDAKKVFARLTEKYPKDELADDATYSLATTYQNEGDYVSAVEHYEALVDSYPESKWTDDCRAAVQDIRWERLSANPQQQHVMPGTNVPISVQSRNIKTIKFTAYRVKLEDLLARDIVLRNHDVNFSQFSIAFGGEIEREQVAAWDLDTQDDGKHAWYRTTIDCPVTARGAYVIEAEGGDVTFTFALIISDLTLVQKTDRRRTIIFAADSVTGRPVAGAKVVAKERWWDYQAPQEERQKLDVHEGVTNESGIFEAELSRSETNRSNSQIEVFVQAGEDRYAVSPQTYSSYWSATQKQYRVYAYTDRPVYRPSQQVHFKALVRVYENGSYETPKAGTTVQVRIRNPKGETIYDREHATNPFGSVSGDLQLTEEPPLGEYWVNVEVASGQWGYAYAPGNRFRVEEYKKPEFEVAVNPASDQVKLGGKVKATVSAQYYFGAPVVEGTVSYKVFRRNWTFYYSPYDPYEWLYGRGYYWYHWRPSYDRSQGELVAEGEGLTDANGEYTIEVDTAKLTEAEHMKATDHLYTFEVDVVDQSRRHIEGTGEVKVTRNQFYAFLSTRNGFYRPGEKVEIEVNTLTPSNAPKSSEGTMKVYKLVQKGKTNEYDRTEVLAEPFKTDAGGRGFYTWRSDEDGRFLFEFSTTDDWDAPVAGTMEVWVAGKDFHGQRYTFSNLEIITDKRTYAEGDTAHLMINTNFPGATILLSTEMEADVRNYEVVQLEGKSQVMDMRITRDHVPNFFLWAYLVHDGLVYAEQREVFVPPERQFVTVKVTADKDRYRPGDTGTFTIEAADYQGHPVVAEASLGLTDESVYSIQGEYAPEIRQYFYGQRRYVNTQYTSSGYFSIYGHEDTGQIRREYQRHGMPPGWHGWYDVERNLIAVYRYTGDYGLGLSDEDLLVVFEGIGGPGGGRFMSRSMELGDSMDVETEGMPPPAANGGGMEMNELAMKNGGGGGEPPLVEAKVREYFPDTAYWNPVVVTDHNGKATVEVAFPDSLTTWRVSARAITERSQVGQVQGKAITTKDLLVRMQAPRFFVERDEVVLSANVHNYLAEAKSVKVRLAIDGYQLQPLTPQEMSVVVPSGGERRVDWRVKAVAEGFVTLTMSALTDEESDAVKTTFPVLIHGVEKVVALNGDVNDRTSDTFKVTVPRAIKEGSGELRIALSPSMAVAMMDALPYLVDYPYGCVEQTMSRFLPAVMVRKTLGDLGIDLADIAERHDRMADDLNLEERTKHLHRTKDNPVYSQSQLDHIVQQGLDRLYGFQNGDGGWGWFNEGRSDAYMSAYVAMGLYLATEAGVPVDPNRLERGFRFLQDAFKNEEMIHLKAYEGYVLSLRKKIEGPELDDVYTLRDNLNAYSMALLALAYHNLGDTEKATIICENLENWVRIDEKYQTASWGARANAYGGRWWWYWYNGDIETNAYVLKAYVTIRPGHKLNPMIARWLMRNREGNRWYSTKDTATAIYGLTGFVVESGEFNPDYTVSVSYDGRVQKSVKVTKDTMFTFDNELVIAGDALGTGDKAITIERDGEGKLYHTTELKYFSLEEGIKAAGQEVHVDRTYYKLEPKKVTKTDTEGREYTELTHERHELKQFETVESGQEIEVELTITADNNYEYLVFEDMKPAGCEPVELTSGRTYAGGLVANMELRDEKVVFFVGWLRQGEHKIAYKIRAEIPGDFHVLPTKSYAMYAPKVRAISDELRMAIKDLEE